MMSSRGASLLRPVLQRSRMDVSILPMPGRCSRPLSTTTVPAKTTATSGGAGLFQRLTSFLVGAGLTALVTQYFILDEVRKGNGVMVAKQAELEQRLAKLEKK